MKKTLLRIALNTLIGIALIYVWSRFVNLEEVLTKLTTINPAIILVVGLCLLISTFLRAARFWILLPKTKITLPQMTFLNYLAQLLSFLIPIRAGEITKAVYISNEGKLPFPKALIWVFVDRMVDFLIVLLLLAVMLFLVPTAIPANISQIIGGLVIILLLGLVVVVYYPKMVRRIVQIGLIIVPIKSLKKLISNISDYLIETFSILKMPPRKQLIILLITTSSWLFESLSWYAVFFALGADVPGFLFMVLGTMLMALSFILPAAPGYLGSLQAAGLLVFSVWLGIDSNTVSAATIIMHLSIIIYILMAGLISLYFLKFDLGEVWKRLKIGKG